jgi:mono/diheme cytochrome c family protein
LFEKADQLRGGIVITKLFCGTAMCLCLMAGVPAAAQDEPAGAQEYRNSCLPCHGEDGTGDGPLADQLTVPPADLTMLARDTDEGIFPMFDLLKVIDGRTVVRAHGSAMPIWGDRFRAEARDEQYSPNAAEIVVRGRILSLLYYLESIQK